MSTKWVDQFCEQLRSQGLDFEIVNRAKGWPETLDVNGRVCFAKSVRYNSEKEEYFIGVDPKKLDDAGSLVLICGGRDSALRDVSLIPWDEFFGALAQGEPVNTYQPPKEYWQYKVHVRWIGGRWILSVQSGNRPKMDVADYRFDPAGFVNALRQQLRHATG